MKKKKISRQEMAEKNFEKGYNCAQSVVLAFEDVLPLERKELAMMAGSFGGGVGRLREVCGAVSGMAIVLGFIKGYDDPEDDIAKAAHYERIQEAAKLFEKETGSMICRELLGLDVKHDAPTPEKRTEEYYQKRPCKDLVGIAAKILEDKIR